MSNYQEKLIAGFNRWAGAHYGLFYLSSLIKKSPENDDIPPIIFWSFITNTLIEADSSEQLQNAVNHYNAHLRSGSKLLPDHFNRSLLLDWVFLLPIIFSCSTLDCDAWWDYFMENFPSENSEEKDVARILFSLLKNYPEELFDPNTLAEKFREEYTSLEACAIIKLGQCIKTLSSQSEHDSFEKWRIALQGILQNIQSGERIKRGFAPSSPVFEDFVLTILTVAEWLGWDNGEEWKIKPYIEDISTRKDERLKEYQLAFCGALFGWIRGYSILGSLVDDTKWRKFLSQQSMGLATKYNKVEDQIGIDNPISFFVANPDHEAAILPNYFQLIEVNSIETSKEKKAYDQISGKWENSEERSIANIIESYVFRLSVSNLLLEGRLSK